MQKMFDDAGHGCAAATISTAGTTPESQGRQRTAHAAAGAIDALSKDMEGSPYMSTTEPFEVETRFERDFRIERE